MLSGNNSCPKLFCSLSCPHGYQLDPQGCYQCRCRDICDVNKFRIAQMETSATLIINFREFYASTAMKAAKSYGPDAQVLLVQIILMCLNVSFQLHSADLDNFLSGLLHLGIPNVCPVGQIESPVLCISTAVCGGNSFCHQVGFMGSGICCANFSGLKQAEFNQLAINLRKAKPV